MLTAVTKLKDALLLRKAVIKLNSILKTRDITLPIKVQWSKLWLFSNHIWMWELDHKEDWLLKNWCFQIVVLEKTLKNPLDSKIKPVNPKGNQSWIFIGRSDAEAPIFWPPDAKSQLIGKYCGAGEGWGQDQKGMTKDEMFGWHHQPNGLEFEKTQGESEGAWNAAVHGAAKRWTWISNWTTTS